jgi:hypothetical protein
VHPGGPTTPLLGAHLTPARGRTPRIGGGRALLVKDLGLVAVGDDRWEVYVGGAAGASGDGCKGPSGARPAGTCRKGDVLVTVVGHDRLSGFRRRSTAVRHRHLRRGRSTDRRPARRRPGRLRAAARCAPGPPLARPSLNSDNPDGPVRLQSVGRGLVTYLILEDQQRVDVIDVVWPD